MSKRGCSWFSAMVVAALLGAARTAHAQSAAAPALPVMLSRVGPAIVRVRRGAWWGTGFVFGSRHTIVTSYELVNGPGALQIVAADGVTRQARVRAWSPSDDLVVLEVEADVAPESLPPAHQPLVAGMDAVMLYEPRDPQLSPATSGGWTSPLPRFSRVSRVSAAELDLDLTVWGLLGDDGAVVLSNSGEVLGIISRRTTKQRRTIVTRVERIERLYQQLGKQG
ncbi:MAG TPA: serine protease, partial [Polyangiaceae bacterium]